MERSTRAFIPFAAAILTVALAAAGISVYGLDQFEPAWGPAISFQVLSSLAAAGAGLAALGSAIGFRLGGGTSRRLSSDWAAASGVLFMAGTIGLAHVLGDRGAIVGLSGTALWFAAGSLGVAYGAIKLFGRAL